MMIFSTAVRSSAVALRGNGRLMTVTCFFVTASTHKFSTPSLPDPQHSPSPYGVDPAVWLYELSLSPSVEVVGQEMRTRWLMFMNGMVLGGYGEEDRVWAAWKLWED